MTSSSPPNGAPPPGSFKVVLLGEGRVGKTSLVSRFVKGKFSDTEESTVQANMYHKKKINIDGKVVDLSIWDTAGQERFHALGPIYYRNASGAVLVYDITDRDTLEKVKSWVRELKQVVGDNIQIVICGNKGDLEKDRAVEVDIAEAYARSQGASHFTTSAKMNMNVDEAFQQLAASILNSAEGSVSPRGSKPSAPKSRSNRVKVDLSAGADGASSTAALQSDVVRPEPITLAPISREPSTSASEYSTASQTTTSSGTSRSADQKPKKKKPCCGD